MNKSRCLIAIIFFAAILSGCKKSTPLLNVHKNNSIILIGNNLPSRMVNYGYFETEIYLRFPDNDLIIRNMGDGGNTPGFRPHAGRKTPWAFPGAEKFQTELAQPSGSTGHFEYPDQWLTKYHADIILCFFGFSESFSGVDGIVNYTNELQAFVDHSLSQKYNDSSAPKLILVSPTAFEDLSSKMDVPFGRAENKKLRIYADTMAAVAKRNEIPFINLFEQSIEWYRTKDQHTIDGLQLNEVGYKKLAEFLSDELFGTQQIDRTHQELLHQAVNEKNWYWQKDFKIPNGVHVYGRRYEPYGPDNYPFELKKIREMTAIRDTAIWMAAKGIEFELKLADSKTSKLPPVNTNYSEENKKHGGKYLYGKEALDRISVAPGYKIDLFASEKEFPDLVNPCQMSFDDKGRLWVAVMPTYPHYKPGDRYPNDKLIILEDTDNDGKADKQIVWADGLHLPVGFELASEGVYISQGTNLKLLADTDEDDRADTEEILLSGFDNHDTHHEISAYCADPSGAIYMGEGLFLHTNVETPYGTVRAANGGFYRYNPMRHHLERTAQIRIPNPWGIAFDDWGQNFYLETSGPALRWMMPSTIKTKYALVAPKAPNLAPPSQRVRPTSGLEFVSSRHFPEDTQGDILLCNTIGFLGIKQHTFIDNGGDFSSKFHQDLLWSDDKNFRPVDLEFAPDGSLYVVDWHNVLIGHMQHNARDPFRDHVHGRIYRITYPERPLVKPAKIDGASIPELLELLKLPEYRTRYRVRRALRGKDPEMVQSELNKWIVNLDPDSKTYDHDVLEALWVSWGINKTSQQLVKLNLESQDFRARAAAVRALRYNGHRIPNQIDLLKQAAADENARVRLESIVTASWLDTKDGVAILDIAKDHTTEEWMADYSSNARFNLTGEVGRTVGIEESFPEHLKGEVLEQYKLGKSIYFQDGYCWTCHQEDGKGLIATNIPPLAGSEWVLEDEKRLIKVTLKGLGGFIRVNGERYFGSVPMMGFEKLLKDDELAAVLTYVRNSFGNKAKPVSASMVSQVRMEIKDRKDYYTQQSLAKE